MRFLLVLSTLIIMANACGDNAYRCVNPDQSVSNDWEVTKFCIVDVGLGPRSTCWCYAWAEDYVTLRVDMIKKFGECCSRHGGDGYYAREC